MMGRICERHQEWCPSGECRWCETPATDKALTYALIPPTTHESLREGLARSLPAVIGGYYGGFDLMPTWHPDATGAVPAIRQANGLVLPARPKPPTDPTLLDDIRAVWDALETKPK